jgi:YfiH family protein
VGRSGETQAVPPPPFSNLDDQSAAPAHAFPVRFWRSPALDALSWLAHGVSERTGGVSENDWASLNLGLHVGDDPESVRENRARAARALGFGPDRMVCVEQVHGANVAVATAAAAGRGARMLDDALPGADALVTNEPNLLLALFFADCVPVLLVDPARRVVAVAHAGWRGLAGGVLENTLAAMRARFGTEPGLALGAIGPCIGPCCYQVGPEVAQRFGPAHLRPSEVPGDNKAWLDLASAARDRLRAAGMRAEAIDAAEECTACLPERYFSHRRDAGNTGRMGAFLAIRTPAAKRSGDQNA